MLPLYALCLSFDGCYSEQQECFFTACMILLVFVFVMYACGCAYSLATIQAHFVV